MLIKVTQEDINNGKKLSCHRCPVALAIAKALNFEARNVIVDGHLVRLYKECEVKPYINIALKPFVREWIKIFDYNYKEDVKPFEFELEGI